jgi:predicted NACHT family NTPase
MSLQPMLQMLESLTDAQIEDFLQDWHSSNVEDPFKRERNLKELRSAIVESDAVRELAKTPLTLTLLARLNRYETMPRYKARLYELCLRFLFNNWDVNSCLEDKGFELGVDSEDKENILQLVAVEMQVNSKDLGGNLISRLRLEKIIETYLQYIGIKSASQSTKYIIEQLPIQNTALCYIGQGFYSFVSQRFLEYLLARYLVKKFNGTREIDMAYLKSHVFSEHGQDSWYEIIPSTKDSIYEFLPVSTIVQDDLSLVFGKCCQKDWWHGVLVLMAGLVYAPFAGELIQCLLDWDGSSHDFNNFFLATKCVMEVRDRYLIESVDNDLYAQLKLLAECNQTPEIRKKAVSAIERTWEDNPLVLRGINRRGSIG